MLILFIIGIIIAVIYCSIHCYNYEESCKRQYDQKLNDYIKSHKEPCITSHDLECSIQEFENYKSTEQLQIENGWKELEAARNELAIEHATMESRIASRIAEFKKQYENSLNSEASIDDAYKVRQSVLDNINKRHQKEFEHIQRTHQKELANIDLKRQKCEKEIEFLQETLNSTQQSFPVIADLVATAREDACLADANYLRNKKNPAYTAADKLRMYASEIRLWSYRAKLAENQIAIYEDLFPWLEEFKEISPRDALEMVKSDDNAKSAYDHYKNWLSPSEYDSLSQSQRNQLALDRYKKRKKSNWEIGIEYERYVGYKYELRGFHVSFIGATHGLEDMGRDLVAQKDNKVYIIQCKRWAQEKTIHEKHIFQLYGTAVLYEMDHPKLDICPLFVTTANLSDTATKVADHLHITIVKNYVIEDYPLIKCNIAHDGEKIYHLPFDQQYDNIIITPSKGEGYAYTIEEAESKGFRHAFKWHSC